MKHETHSPRRGLSLHEAALYIRCSVDKFNALMSQGRMPQPRLIDNVRSWDVHELDVYYDALPRDERTAAERKPGFVQGQRRPGQIEPA